MVAYSVYRIPPKFLMKQSSLGHREVVKAFLDQMTKIGDFLMLEINLCTCGR